MQSGYFCLYTLSDGFYYETILDVDNTLLCFTQISAEIAAPASFETLTQVPQTVFVYKPQSVSMVPEAFAAVLSKDDFSADILTHESTLEWANQRVVLIQEVAKKNVPQALHVKEISDVELMLKLYLKGIWKATTRFTLVVTRFELGFHLVLLESDNLLFANTFYFTAYEEVLYFCLQVLKDREIMQESTSLVYSSVDYSETVLAFWQPYFNTVVSIESILPGPRVEGEVPFSLQPYMLLLSASLCA
jgi:hypothetical protein